MKILRKRIRNAAGEILRGDFHPSPGSNELVIVCHGFGKTWDKNRPLYRSICAAFQANGVSAFRFSFSGRAPSEGKAENSSYSKQRADLAAVIDFLSLKIRPRTVSIIAHSFGSVAAVLQAESDERVRQLLLVAPRLQPRRSLIARSIEEKCGSSLEVLAAADRRNFPVGPVVIGGIEYLFGRQYVADLLHTDVLAALENIRIPVTILRGENDNRIAEEEMLSAVMRNALISYIPIPDAGHSFGSLSQRDALCRKLLQEYRAKLPAG